MIVTYSKFQQYWQRKGKCEEVVEEWWIYWHDIEEEAGEWDNPRRFEVLNQYCVDSQVCETAFKDAK